MSIKRNTIINIAGAVIPMAVMLVTVPLYLKRLGDERYGVLSLVWLILGYFSFLEMGLGKATANQIAKANEGFANDRAEIFWTALLLNIGIGTIAATALWIVGGYLLQHMLSMQEDFRAELVAALPWMSASLPLALVSSVLNGALEGRNRFFELNVLQIITNTVFQVAPLAIAYQFGPSLALVIPAAVASRAVMALMFMDACRRYVPLHARPSPSYVRACSLFSYGGWVAITSIVGPLLETIERFVIGAMAGAAAVTHYTVPTQLVGKIKILPGALARALFPSFSSASSAQAEEMALSSVKTLSLIMTAVVLIAIVALEPFLRLWLGEGIASTSTSIGKVLLIGVWSNSIAHVPYFLLQAQGRPDLVAKVHMVELPFYVLFIGLGIYWGGLIGAAAVWSTRCMVEAILLLMLSNLLRRVVIQSTVHLMVISLALYFSGNLRI